jgi:hypothetical protein
VRSWRWKHAGGRFSALPPQPCAVIDPVQHPWTPPVFILDLGMDAVSLVLPVFTDSLYQHDAPT